MKNPNPKDSIGSSKLPFHLWPETASALGALALLDGALKYGRSNYRAAPVRASIYYDAARRHLAKWFEGEETDPDSGVPHLGHVLACLAILVDAGAAGTLIDDRNAPGGYLQLIANLTPHVARLQALHKDKNPKHCTIADKSAD
ncbi:dATP/dGTP diphosphohydrolase domain-containing protein [Burkholderia sp. 22PA0106]|uniref:dATP/dGTP diphosphohydrolase domain-containing protein n=1 Tax=Burkholderia sp. 22PA0106 TaxID=3237371 RepID=UPI0039C369BF